MLCENPRYKYSRALNYLFDSQYISNKKFSDLIPYNAKVYPTAIIDEGASIGDGYRVELYGYIHSNVVMNINCPVGAYTSISHVGFIFE